MGWYQRRVHGDSCHTTSMQYLILLSLAACALSAPQQVPYVHQEIPAEPYVHVEIPAETYVHQEVPAEPYYGGEPTGYAGPAWTGGCVNNLGQGVPCRQWGVGEDQKLCRV